MLTLEHLSYTYPQQKAEAHPFVLQDICLTIHAGTHACVVGANGSGKTTLLDIISGRRRGYIGRVLLRDGDNNSAVSSAVSNSALPQVKRFYEHMAFVHQDAALQFISTSIRENLAFALQNYGYSQDDIDERIAYVTRVCGVRSSGSIDELSGGEAQKLLIAQTLVADPSCMILDEAFSHLDIENHLELRGLINRLVHPASSCDDGSPFQAAHNTLLSTAPAILEVTHSLLDVAFADEVYVLEAGHLVAHTSAREFLQNSKLMERAGFFAHSSNHELKYAEIQKNKELFSLRDFSWSYPVNTQIFSRSTAKKTHAQDSLTRRGEDCSDIRETSRPLALNLSQGDLCIIAGRSGSGKTCCALNIAGIFSSHTGQIKLEGKRVSVGDIGFVHQQTEDMLFAPTVLDEVMTGLIHQGMDEVSARACAQNSLIRMGIHETFFECNPYELSGGMRRRVGIAAMLALDKKMYIFDEPSASLDGFGRRAVFDLIDDMRRHGKAVIVISHDIYAWVHTAHLLVLISNMQCVWKGFPKDATREDYACAHMEHAFDEMSWHADPKGLYKHINKKKNDFIPRPSTHIASYSSEDDIGEPSEVKHVVDSVRPRIGYAMLLVVGYAIALMSTTNLVVLGICAIGACIPMTIIRILRSHIRMVLWPVVLLSMCALLSNSLCFTNCTSADVVPFLGVFLRLEGVLRSIVLTLRLVGFSCVLLWVVCSYTALEFARLCTSLMRPLTVWGVNITYAELILSIALTSIPRIYQGAHRIITAQRLRGISFSKGTLFERMGNWMSVLVPLIMTVFREAEDRSAYMIERGFGSKEEHNT